MHERPIGQLPVHEDFFPETQNDHCLTMKRSKEMIPFGALCSSEIKIIRSPLHHKQPDGGQMSEQWR